MSQSQLNKLSRRIYGVSFNKLADLCQRSVFKGHERRAIADVFLQRDAREEPTLWDATVARAVLS